jgi:hypothetical protein
MRNTPSLRDLLVALYDSMQAARDHADNLAARSGEPAGSDSARRALQILSMLGSTSVSSSTAFSISEMTLSFDCELYHRRGKYGLALRRKHFWRTPKCLPVQIRLYGSQPLKTEVLLDGKLLQNIAGRPVSTSEDGNGLP